MTAQDIAAVIDHTLLKADASADEIERLCQEALDVGFVTVCVNPRWVADAAAWLRGSRIGICSVVGFPLGAHTTATKVFETEAAIASGATEIDMVIDLGALKSGDHHAVAQDIVAVVASCRAAQVRSKVIIETALLNEAEKKAACLMTRDAGADFVKTSTGFGPRGATVEDVTFLRWVVGPNVGVKASGGIRTLATLQAMLSAGATRIGTSAGVAIVREALVE